MLCAQAWKPGSQHAGEKRGVAGLLLGTLEKTLMLGKIEGRRRRGRQDEMVRWLHRLNGHEFESMHVARASASWLSSHGRGLGPRDALKKDNQGVKGLG